MLILVLLFLYYKLLKDNLDHTNQRVCLRLTLFKGRLFSLPVSHWHTVFVGSQYQLPFQPIYPRQVIYPQDYLFDIAFVPLVVMPNRFRWNHSFRQNNVQ